MSECIGIIAGGGQFPALVAQGAHEKGYKVALCGFSGYTDTSLLKNVVDSFQLVKLGQFNRMVRFFHRQGVTKLCLAGAINKPRALHVKPDFRAIRILLSLYNKGDDALLRAILKELEQEGFTMLSASSFLPSLHCPTGVLSYRQPDEELWAEIAYGWPIAENIGRFDIGQFLVVKQQMVIAVECLEGTDATLERGGKLGGKGCVAIKMVKPGQDERADLPAIGLETMRLLVQYKFNCIAIAAGKTLFFDMSEALLLADKHNICVVALSDTDIAQYRKV